MIVYQSRTGTARNLAAMRAVGFRLLVSAAGVWRSEGMPYALDNGAWSSFQRGESFDESRFDHALQTMGAGADWAVVPDVVAGGAESLRLSERWLARVLDACPVALIAVQDGMTAADVRGIVGPRVGIAIGGSDAWKEQALARGWFSGLGCYLHALRVNTRRRIALASSAGCDSFDGSSGTRFALTIPDLDRWNRQETLCFDR